MDNQDMEKREEEGKAGEEGKEDTQEHPADTEVAQEEIPQDHPAEPTEEAQNVEEAKAEDGEAEEESQKEPQESVEEAKGEVTAGDEAEDVEKLPSQREEEAEESKENDNPESQESPEAQEVAEEAPQEAENLPEESPEDQSSPPEQEKEDSAKEEISHREESPKEHVEDLEEGKEEEASHTRDLEETKEQLPVPGSGGGSRKLVIQIGASGQPSQQSPRSEDLEGEEYKLQEQRYKQTLDSPYLEEGADSERKSVGSSGRQDSRQQQVSIEELEESIIRYCRETGQLYEDEDFPAGPTSLYKDIDNIPEYDRSFGCEEWRRPREIAENAELYLTEPSGGDIQQGALNDRWFLGALCVLCNSPGLLEKLFVNTEYMNEFGFVTCQFFVNGTWEQVIIDTRLPYNASYGAPIYAHCREPGEMWLPLLEKAYAKVHGCYEALHKGKMSEALVDVTGEASEKHLLKEPATAALIESGEFWAYLTRYFRTGCLLGCSNVVPGESSDEITAEGIWNGHAYGIMDLRDVKGLRLVRIRNPWGEGEWKGNFADEDEEWDKHRGLKDELNYEFGKDGTWWMSFEDWGRHFNQLYVCRVFPEKWQKYSIDGRWEGKTAGGPPPIGVEQATDGHFRLDSDDKWFNNPQYRLTVRKKTTLFISLVQEDQRLSGRPYLPCNFLILRANDKKNRIWEKRKDDVIVVASEGPQPKVLTREIARDLVLEPPEGKKEANFVIVPNLEIDGKKLENETNKKNKGRPFWLRVFSSQPVELAELAETFERHEVGKWDEHTCGGRRLLDKGKDNQDWCRNPQYFLQVTTNTLLKIILRKTIKNKFNRGPLVGVTVCQAPAKPIAKKQQSGKTRTHQTGIEREIPVYERERKLQVLQNEWYVESSFQYEEYSCLFLKLEPNHGPFLVVPSLAQKNLNFNYSLTIYSNYPVTLEKLEDSRNVVMSGGWSASTSGGSHLYDKPYVTQIEKMTWGNNPKYLLKFAEDTPVKAKITLSRPESFWSGKIARNTVGCMIALYIFDGILERPVQERWINKPEFMPLNELIETIDEASPLPQGYLLMPTTYDSNIVGPFVLSVSSENEFQLQSIVPK